MTAEQRSGRSKHWEGQVIDGLFPLRQYLGGCETGAVFLTEYQGQRAAIKVVTPADGKLERRLWNWRLASKISHPHLIRLFKAGRSELDTVEIAYVVMEYADENLGEVLRERPLTPLEAKEMLGPALDALDCVHREGFVHGRLKPSNILAVDDSLKLSIDDLCGVGDVADLPAVQGAYRSPEVAAGGKHSPAGDIWALGVTLVEALTQRQPSWTATNELVLPEGVFEPFRDFTRNCLRLNPEERWTAATLAGHPALKASVARKKWTTWWFAAVAAALVMVFLLIWIMRPNRPAAPLNTPAAVEAAPVPRSSSPQSSTTEVSASKTPRKAAGQRSSATSAASAPPPMQVAAPEPTTTGASTAPLAAEPTGPISPDVVNQVMPNVLANATRSIQGKVTVTVRVQADAYGNVKRATLEPPAGSRYFSDVTLKAVRRWKFRPVRTDEVYRPQDWIVRWEFTRAETKVSVERAEP